MTDAPDPILDFTPVPLERTRCDGWTPSAQRRFVLALYQLGGVAAAARACSMTAKSAHRLRARAGAGSFSQAWDIALDMGRDRAFEHAIDRGVNGYAVPMYRNGRLTGVRHTYDNRLLYAACVDPAEAVGRAGAKAAAAPMPALSWEEILERMDVEARAYGATDEVAKVTK